MQAFFVILVYLLAMCAPSHTTAQVRVTDWQTYSSMLNVRSTATDRNGVVWAATSGGVFSYNFATRQTQEFRNINALFGIDIATLEIHPRTGDVYAGGFNGIINVYNGRNWRPITDIFTSSVVRKQINDFLFLNDSLVMVAGDFGLTVLNVNRSVFAETVPRLGTLQPGVAVKQLLLAQGRIWAATERGIVSAQANSRSFANPAVWQMHPLTRRAAETGAVAIAESNGVLFAAESTNLWRMNTTATTTAAMVFDSLARRFDEPITTLTAWNNELFFTTPFQLVSLTRGTLLNVFPGTMNSASVIDSAGVRRLVVNTNDGFRLLSTQPNSMQFGRIILNSPAGNRFRDLAIDNQGNLWCATGTGQNAVSNDGPGLGLYRLTTLTGQWLNVNQSTLPELGGGGYYQISTGTNDTVWASSWGTGTVMLSAQSGGRIGATRFTERNSALRGISPGSSFVVTGAPRTDTRSTTWIPNFLNDGIIARDAQGRFYAFNNAALSQRNYVYLTIDQAGTKWIATERGTTLVAFNDRGTLDNTADDVWYQVPSERLNISQRTIAADNAGTVWVGTAQGLFSIANASAILFNQNPFFTRIEPLADQVVNAIAVDALNYKWIGTNNGVWVLDANRDTVVAQFTTENSPLVSNTIFSIAIDNNTGRIYFGTGSGLSSAQTLAVKPNETFMSMRCYPQPFIPAQDTELVIDGLAENTQVKISTIDGMVVRSFPTTNSRTIIWDGLDQNGRPVQSGVYLIAGYSGTTNETGVIKAMVIQR